MNNIAKTHGGYCLKKPERIRRYGTAIRKALIKDISGGVEEDLSAQQVILIDSVIDMAVICKMMGEYVAESGVMRGANLQPCLLHSYLNYKGAIHKHLVTLGLERREKDSGPVYLEDM